LHCSDGSPQVVIDQSHFCSSKSEEHARF
jgi:hypothetical protein